MFWVTSTRIPNGASPFSGYLTQVFASNGRNLNDVAFVIDGDYPYAGYGGWFVYPETYKLPTGGLTYPNVDPDKNSVNPFIAGNPAFAKKRGFSLILTADNVSTNDLPQKLRKRLPSGSTNNHIFFPSTDDNFSLMSRVYNEREGYDLGGTGGPTNTAWAKITTFDVHTGEPVDCELVQPLRDEIQAFTPWNTVGYAGIQRVPINLRGLLPARPQEDAPEWTAPKPDPDLVEFFRTPAQWTGWQGGVVLNPNQDTPDFCGNYIVADLDPNRIAMWRVPKVSTFQPFDLPKGAATPATDVGAYNYQVFGRLRMIYAPGEPDTFAIADEEIQVDEHGGATFVVWPITMGPLDTIRVINMAEENGWNLMQGNLPSITNYQFGVVVRSNGPAPDYQGGSYPSEFRNGVPCMFGPQEFLDPYGLTVQPEGTPFFALGSEWAVTFENMGPYAPQGVQCTADEFLQGLCEQRLRDHIENTGGSYNAD